MSTTTKEAGIALMRSVIAKLAADDPVDLVIAWREGGPESIQSMDFGHPILIDALIMHLFRVSVRKGVEQFDPAQVKQ